MNSFFEIHAPGIDSEDLLKRVEESARSRGYDPAEIERIRDLSFTPVSPGSGRGFDPILTSELLERPVTRPDFTSRKFRLLRLPLINRVASRVFELLVQIHTKLDENRVQAFYNVIHELIAINYRYDRLHRRFDDVLTENLQLRGRLEEMLVRVGEDWPDQPLADQPSADRRSAENRVPDPAVVPEIDPEIRTRNERLLETISMLFPRKSDAVIFCVDDEWGHFAFELRSLGFQKVSVNTPDLLQRMYMDRVRGLAVVGFSAESALASCSDNSQDLISLLNLGDGTGRPEIIVSLAIKKLKPGGHLVLRIASDLPSRTVFRRHGGYTARRSDLLNFLSELGLVLVIPEGDDASAVEPVQGSEEFFEPVLRKPDE